MAGFGPDLEVERALLAHGIKPVAGVDEAGRGPLAGPVVAAAVCLDPLSIPDGLNDSKKLSRKKREELFDQIRQQASVGIGVATSEEIDSINILQACHLAMRRAIELLPHCPAHILIDGHLTPPDLPARVQPVVKGDGRCLSIAAASIIAKVHRDRIMVDLAQQHPGYGWEKNAGYGTSVHLEALQNLGPTPHHRRSFRPVYNIL